VKRLVVMTLHLVSLTWTFQRHNLITYFHCVDFRSSTSLGRTVRVTITVGLSWQDYVPQATEEERLDAVKSQEIDDVCAVMSSRVKKGWKYMKVERRGAKSGMDPCRKPRRRCEETASIQSDASLRIINFANPNGNLFESAK
jgi:hypothetical protein